MPYFCKFSISHTQWYRERLHNGEGIAASAEHSATIGTKSNGNDAGDRRPVKQGYRK